MTSEIITTTPDREIVSTRIVNAPREFVYTAWTNPNHLKNWWGPKGFTNTFNEFDLRPGGKWSFVMHAPDKGNYPNECEFIQIEKPSLIAWKRFSQPLFQIMVTFAEETDNRTKIVFKMLFDSVDECNKIRTFAPEKNEENFDRLEYELTKMTNQ